MLFGGRIWIGAAHDEPSDAIVSVPLAFRISRDPKDEKYLNLAIGSNAQYLVTRDNDLLDLMKDASFRAAYPNLEILDPVEFLQRLP